MAYGNGSTGGPRVRFEVLGEAWALFQQQMGVWIAAQCVLIGVAVVVSLLGGGALFSFAASVTHLNENLGPLAVVLCVPGFLLLVVVASAILWGGVMRMAIKQVRGETIEMKDLFSATDSAASLTIASFVTGLLEGIASYLFYIPALILGGLWMLTIPLIVDRRMAPIEAMTTSWNALSRDWITAAGFYFVVTTLVAVAFSFCFVPGLFVLPLLPLATALIYRDFFPATAE